MALPHLSTWRTLTRAWFAATTLLVCSQAALSQTPPEPAGSLRERMKEKLQERRSARQDAAPAADALTRPGTFEFSIRHGGMERAYLVHIPTGYRSGTPTPVVFAFHGGGGDMKLQASEHYGLVDKADSAGFVAVFPNGYSRLPGGKLATWNAGNCCAQARDAGSDDVGLVRAIWTRLQTQITADPHRVYATGMSNGGMLSHRLACEMGDVFKAVAPVAGTDGTLSCQPARPVSVLQIHAKDDTHVLFNGGAGDEAFKDKSKVANFVSVPETIQRWTQRNQCTAPARRVLSVPGAYCDAYQSCAGGTQVQLCVTETGGHSWPGGSKARPRSEPASTAISANDVMWDFFQRVSAP